MDVARMPTLVESIVTLWCKTGCPSCGHPKMQELTEVEPLVWKYACANESCGWAIYDRTEQEKHIHVRQVAAYYEQQVDAWLARHN